MYYIIKSKNEGFAEEEETEQAELRKIYTRIHTGYGNTPGKSNEQAQSELAHFEFMCRL